MEKIIIEYPSFEILRGSFGQLVQMLPELTKLFEAEGDIDLSQVNNYFESEKIPLRISHDRTG